MSRIAVPGCAALLGLSPTSRPGYDWATVMAEVMVREEAAGLRISYWEPVWKDWLSWNIADADGNWSGDMEIVEVGI